MDSLLIVKAPSYVIDDCDLPVSTSKNMSSLSIYDISLGNNWVNSWVAIL